jgi:hypothetical protein
LVKVLRPHTKTPESCWFCVWDGFGFIEFDGVSERVRLPERDYVLGLTPQSAHPIVGESPQEGVPHGSPLSLPGGVPA